MLAREALERGEVELETEQLADDACDLVVQRLDADAAGRRLDPYLPSADDAVQPALVPEVGEVGAEAAEALRREGEVVRLGDRQERHGRAQVSSARSTSCRSSNGS